MVQDDKPVGLDGIEVKFDDERVVYDAGIALVATVAERLGVEALAQQRVRLRGDRAGAAHAGRKVMALIFAMVLGADSSASSWRTCPKGGTLLQPAADLADEAVDVDHQLRLHARARLPPAARDQGGHSEGAAHPSQEGVGEHAEGDAALLR